MKYLLDVTSATLMSGRLIAGGEMKYLLDITSVLMSFILLANIKKNIIYTKNLNSVETRFTFY